MSNHQGFALAPARRLAVPALPAIVLAVAASGCAWVPFRRGATILPPPEGVAYAEPLLADTTAAEPDSSAAADTLRQETPPPRRLGGARLEAGRRAGRQTPLSADLLLRRTIAAGWFCVAASIVFLWLSRPTAHGAPRPDIVMWATWLMLARLAGIGSFSIGCVAIYSRRWHHGMTLLLLSVVLPFLAFHWHVTI